MKSLCINFEGRMFIWGDRMERDSWGSVYIWHKNEIVGMFEPQHYNAVFTHENEDGTTFIRLVPKR